MKENTKAINNAFKAFRWEINETLYGVLFNWCDRILDLAIEFRMRDRKAHNFTGNLLNSIVVILYANTENIKRKVDFFAVENDNVKIAIRPKMSSVTTRGGARKYRYRFHPDYDQRDSSFMPSVPTNGGWGYEDAQKFASTYVPKAKTDFVIVVAYTTEYAEFIEQQRHTAGFMSIMKSTEKAAVEFIGLKKVA